MRAGPGTADRIDRNICGFEASIEVHRILIVGPVKQRGLFQEIARRIAFLHGTDAIRNKDGDMEPP